MVIQREAYSLKIPLEDIEIIICIGAGIRISTLGLSRLSNYKIVVLAIDEKYKPTSIITPFEGNVRAAKAIRMQISMSEELKNGLWKAIVKQKIENQARTLDILNIHGSKLLFNYSAQVQSDDYTNIESLAAREYFQFFHPGLNRRDDAPINGGLNYGYAIIRSTLIRAIIANGLLPAIGIHHNNGYNYYNLADDLIEPWRPMADLAARDAVGDTKILTKTQRQKIASVLHNACLINGSKLSVISGIDKMVLSYKRAIEADDSTLLKLPTIMPVERISSVIE